MTRSGPKLASPVADRDLLVFAALLVLAAAATVVNILLVLAAGIAAALLGAPVQLTPADGWITTGPAARRPRVRGAPASTRRRPRPDASRGVRFERQPASAISASRREAMSAERPGRTRT